MTNHLKPTEIGYEFLKNVPLKNLAAYLTGSRRTIFQVRPAYDPGNALLPDMVAVYGCSRLESSGPRRDIRHDF